MTYTLCMSLIFFGERHASGWATINSTAGRYLPQFCDICKVLKTISAIYKSDVCDIWFLRTIVAYN